MAANPPNPSNLDPKAPFAGYAYIDPTSNLNIEVAQARADELIRILGTKEGVATAPYRPTPLSGWTLDPGWDTLRGEGSQPAVTRYWYTQNFAPPNNPGGADSVEGLTSADSVFVYDPTVVAPADYNNYSDPNGDFWWPEYVNDYINGGSGSPRKEYNDEDYRVNQSEFITKINDFWESRSYIGSSSEEQNLKEQRFDALVYKIQLNCHCPKEEAAAANFSEFVLYGTLPTSLPESDDDLKGRVQLPNSEGTLYFGTKSTPYTDDYGSPLYSGDKSNAGHPPFMRGENTNPNSDFEWADNETWHGKGDNGNSYENNNTEFLGVPVSDYEAAFVNGYGWVPNTNSEYVRKDFSMPKLSEEDYTWQQRLDMQFAVLKAEVYILNDLWELEFSDKDVNDFVEIFSLNWRPKVGSELGPYTSSSYWERNVVNKNDTHKLLPKLLNEPQKHINKYVPKVPDPSNADITEFYELFLAKYLSLTYNTGGARSWVDNINKKIGNRNWSSVLMLWEYIDTQSGRAMPRRATTAAALRQLADNLNLLQSSYTANVNIYPIPDIQPDTAGGRGQTYTATGQVVDTSNTGQFETTEKLILMLGENDDQVVETSADEPNVDLTIADITPSIKFKSAFSSVTHGPLQQEWSYSQSRLPQESEDNLPDEKSYPLVSSSSVSAIKERDKKNLSSSWQGIEVAMPSGVTLQEKGFYQPYLEHGGAVDDVRTMHILRPSLSLDGTKSGRISDWASVVFDLGEPKGYIVIAGTEGVNIAGKNLRELILEEDALDWAYIENTGDGPKWRLFNDSIIKNPDTAPVGKNADWATLYQDTIAPVINSEGDPKTASARQKLGPSDGGDYDFIYVQEDEDGNYNLARQIKSDQPVEQEAEVDTLPPSVG